MDVDALIDRGIGIGRFGVEKTTFDFCTEMYGAPAKNCSGPENRDASILVGKHIANAMIVSMVFDKGSRNLPNGARARAGAGLGWVGWLARNLPNGAGLDFLISLENCTARQQKSVRAPKTAMRRF